MGNPLTWNNYWSHNFWSFQSMLMIFLVKSITIWKIGKKLRIQQFPMILDEFCWRSTRMACPILLKSVLILAMEQKKTWEFHFDLESNLVVFDCCSNQKKSLNYRDHFSRQCKFHLSESNNSHIQVFILTTPTTVDYMLYLCCFIALYSKKIDDFFHWMTLTTVVYLGNHSFW